jgi:TPR repeat protein
MIRAILFLTMLAVLAPAIAIADPFSDAEGAYKQGNYDDAIKILFPAAHGGDPRAKKRLHEIALKKDQVEEDGLLQKALAGGPKEQYDLGILYAHRAQRTFEAGWMADTGHAPPAGVTEAKKAVRWLRKAAKGGLGDAELQIGRIYQRGWLGRPDYAGAVRWYRRAVDHGLAPPIDYLYAEGGHGITRNYEEAAFWFEVTGSQECDIKDERCQKVFTNLTHQQRERVQRRVAAWKLNHAKSVPENSR